MRYPRSYLAFDTPIQAISEEFFQKISGLKSKVYLSNHSKPVKTIEKELSEIKKFDYHFTKSFDRQFLILSTPKIFDFLIAYFSDKALKIYWIDGPYYMREASQLFIALQHLAHMKSHANNTVFAYLEANKIFEIISDRKLIGVDIWVKKLLVDYYHWDNKTTLECEILVLLKARLRLGIANRIDL